MKKRILCLALAAMMLLSGCCMSHEWQEADCVTPRTCTKCQETEGEALGHTPGEWEQVSLDHVSLEQVRVKRCTVCGEQLEEETVTLTVLHENGKFLLTAQQVYDRVHYVRDTLVHEIKHPMSIHWVKDSDENFTYIEVYNHYLVRTAYKGYDDFDICFKTVLLDEEGHAMTFADRNACPVGFSAAAHRHDGVGATSLIILLMVLDPTLTYDEALDILNLALDNGGELVHNGILYKISGNNDFWFLEISVAQ